MNEKTTYEKFIELQKKWGKTTTASKDTEHAFNYKSVDLTCEQIEQLTELFKVIEIENENGIVAALVTKNSIKAIPLNGVLSDIFVTLLSKNKGPSYVSE